MSSSDRVTPKKELYRLLRMGLETAKRVQSISGTFGEAIKTAVESKHLHSGAFGLANRLTKMDEAKRIDFLASFDAYREHCEAAGGPWSSGHYGDFVKQAEEAEAREAAKDAELRRQQEVDESVERVRTGIKPLEAEGGAPVGMPDPEPVDVGAQALDGPVGKVTALDKVRQRKAGREAKAAEAAAAKLARGEAALERRAKRGKAKSPDEVQAAADAAEGAAGPAPEDGEAEPEERDPGRRYDAQGNTLPPDISGDDWDAPPTAPEEPVGMPGAEDAGSVH